MLSTTQHGSVVKEAVSMVILFTLNNALVVEMVFNNYTYVFQNILDF